MAAREEPLARAWPPEVKDNRRYDVRWVAVPASVLVYAAGLPRLWGVSHEACVIMSLFFAVSLAFGSFINEVAMHSLYFDVRGAGQFVGFPRSIRVWHWVMSFIILHVLSKVCDPSIAASEKHFEITITFLLLTYVDFAFGAACAAHWWARGAEPDAGLYALALAPAVIYSVMLLGVVVRLNGNFLLMSEVADSAIIFVLPLLSSAFMCSRAVAVVPSLLSSDSPSVQHDDAASTVVLGLATPAQAIYAMMSAALLWAVPPLQTALLLVRAPSQMLTEWRSITTPETPQLSVPAQLGSWLALALAAVLPAVLLLGKALVQGARSTATFLHSLARSERHGRIEEYEKFEIERGAQERSTWGDSCAGPVDAYYDLATEFFEWAWGTCFHMSDRHKNESLRQALLRQEYYLATRLGVSGRAHVLDWGCGIGGPARNIARFTGTRVTGVTVNKFQVNRGNFLSEKEGMRTWVEIINARTSLSSLTFPDSSFDAAYAVASTCHAPDRERLYGEILRVLRPGAVFACYEWCLTDKYDPEIERHREIKRSIELGIGLPHLTGTAACSAALRAAGFEVLEARDCALDRTWAQGGDPWYRPMSPSWNPLARWPRFLFNRAMVHAMPTALKMGESVGLLPTGTHKTQVMLQTGATGLACGGEEGIFTPMWLMVARKPA